MTTLPHTRWAPFALGMASTIGTIGLMLFFMPILGIPLSSAGLFFGLLGLLTGRWSGVRMRWILQGIVVSSLALAVNVAIVYAPGGYNPEPKVPRMWQGVPDRPFVPPPASP